MLDELRTASDLLQLALDRYLNACLALKHSSEGYPSLACQPQPERFTSPVVINEVPLLVKYDLKLRKSKAAILQYLNLRLDVVPISRLPADILVRIFRHLVEGERNRPRSARQETVITKYPMTLSHVCANWRQIVLQSSSLWSCITLTSSIRTNKRQFAYVDFHTKHSMSALVDIYIVDLSAIQTSETSDSTTFIDPFTGRIRSLELWPGIYPSESAEARVKAGYLITKCLSASNDTLKQFTLHMGSMIGWHPFMESVPRATSRHGVMIDLPHDQLEETLSSINRLWLEGLFFKWESKAYCGLTALTLEDYGRSCSIPELQLMKILASSPQLRWLDIDFKITPADYPPSPTHLPELEVLVGDISLLQFVSPGSKKLTVVITWQPQRDSGLLYNSRIKDFFASANIARFYSDEILANTSDVCYLLSAAPGAQVLALSRVKLVGILPNTTVYPSLDELYLLDHCELERSLLLDMIDRWNIKKLVLWGDDHTIDDLPNAIINKEALEEMLPEWGKTQLEFVSRPDHQLPKDFFMGQVIA
ncbi:hypothetical protein FRC11_013320 [Ceratobasidium sp. 423]|nr:hypothetical protein FRC11_013320 [Ceratobasidium sp. 423]